MMDALALRENAQAQLAQIKTLESGVDYLNKVKAIEVWAKAEKKDAELQNMIAEQKIRTQRILGQLLKESEVSKNVSNQHLVGRTTQPSTLQSFGISKDQSSAFQKIAALPEEVFEREIAVAKEESEKRVELTTSRVLFAAKEYEQQKKKDEAQITTRDQQLIEALKRGETVIVNQKVDLAAIKYAETQDKYVRCDRFSDFGNPFEMDKDGDRDEVCDNYEQHYLPFKPSIHKQLMNLKGKALGCWCAPLRCHCDTLKAIIDANN
jgi:hypothetical protein